MTGEGRARTEMEVRKYLFICPELFGQVVTWQPVNAVHWVGVLSLAFLPSKTNISMSPTLSPGSGTRVHRDSP